MSYSDEVVTYGVEEVERMTQVPVRRLQRWHDRGWVSASVLTSGGNRRYTTRDVHRVRIMRALREDGISARAAARALRAIDAEL